MFSVEFEPRHVSQTNIFRPMWTPLDPEHLSDRALKHVLKTTSDDVFIRLYYAGLSILGRLHRFLDTRK
jgi:hypothetical protein